MYELEISNYIVFLSRNYRLIVAPRKFWCSENKYLPEKRTSNFQGATIRPIVPRHKHYFLYCYHQMFFCAPVQNIILNYFQLFMMKAVTVKCRIFKRKQTNAHLIQFQLFIFHKPACLQKNVHEWVLSICVISADGHYLNKIVFLSRNCELIVALWKFDVWHLPEKQSLKGKYASFKNIKFPRGSYQTDW